MKKAGLNPALMYGMGGGGGQSVGSGASSNVSGGSAGDPNAGARNIMEFGLMAAQTKLLEAQAKKAEAEATKTSGIETELSNTELQNKQLELEIANITKADTIKGIAANAEIAMQNVQKATNEARVGKETQDAQINRIKYEAIGAMLNNQATEQGIKLDKA